MKYCRDLYFITEKIVTVSMADKKVLSGQCYNKVERYGSRTKHFSSILSTRKKNNSFSCVQTPDSGHNTTVNYYSDNSSGYIQANAKKFRQRRSLSSSPTLYSHYAGAKFSEPPAPNVLPLPPIHWTESMSAENTPRSVTPVDFEKVDLPCTSTPLFKAVVSNPIMNHSVELFFKKCSFNQIETCKDFTQQLKTLLNVQA